jgi:hypothetical protein
LGLLCARLAKVDKTLQNKSEELMKLLGIPTYVENVVKTTELYDILKNEEKNILPMLESVIGCFDEIHLTYIIYKILFIYIQEN